MIGTALTAVIGLVAKGSAAKARAGALAGAIVSQISSDNPLVVAFWKGVTTGALPKVTELGIMVGQVVIGGLIGRVMVYWSPANAPAKPAKN
jgi:hypothetical protein